MRSIEAIINAEQFMKRWNDEHKFLNILDLQTLLWSPDDEDKMRQLKRRLVFLKVLQEDLIIEVDHRFQDNDQRNVYLSLLSQTGAKIVTVEGVLVGITEALVAAGLSHLMDEALSLMFDFDVEVLTTEDPG